MKTLLVFLAGLGIGAFGLYYYHLQSETTARKLAASETRLGETARSAARTAATKAQEVAADMSGAVSGRIEAWHLSPDDIKADLAKTGQVVRANATRAGKKSRMPASLP